MSYDFLGQMFGKARRRKIEAAAAQVLMGGQKPVAVDFGVLGTRLAIAATGALVTATLNHSLPQTAGGILSVAGVGVTGALPTALKASGILTALSPDTLSAVQGLTRAVQTVLAAPANAKKAAFQAAVADEVQNVLNKTGQFERASAEGSAVLQNAPQTPTEGQGAIAAKSQPAAAAVESKDPAIAESQDPAIAESQDPAVRETGGNQ